jgi:AmiR/NasT family two-component response regulator
MKNLLIKLHDAATGEIVEREMNEQELNQYKLDQKTSEIESKIEAQKAADKAALLSKLGITEDEAHLLLS